MRITEDKFYALLRSVPRGKVTTYKALAAFFNSKAYRHVGQLLRKNPNAPEVPCHRVVASDGTIGGYMGKTSGKALQKKRALLKSEGVRIKGDKIVDFADICTTSFQKES